MSTSSSSSTATATTAGTDNIWIDAKKGEPLSASNVSRADYEDVRALEKLVGPNTLMMFNTEDVLAKVHNSAVSLLVKNGREEIVAGLCMTDYPNVPALPSDDWVTWVRRLYGIHDLNGYNTFWVHLALYDEQYETAFMDPIMRYLFERHPKNYVLFVVPPSCHYKVGYLKDISTTILPNDYKSASKVQTLRLLMRQNFSISYKVRRAVEEDNDDLVPLIDRYSTRLKELYGEFYIAEILTRHPDAGRQLIVAEHKGLAVSVLCLNENVNYEDLNQSFDLHVFTGLFKPRSYRVISKNRTHTHESVLTFSTLNNEFKTSRISGLTFSQRSPSTNTSIHEEDASDSVDVEFGSCISLGVDIPVVSEIEKGARGVRLTDEIDAIVEPSCISGIDFAEIIGEYDLSEEDVSFDGGESGVVFQFQEFIGEKNAFVIEIAASATEHEYSLELLLETAFECFPTKQYCIMTIPSDRAYFNLLRHFVRITPRRTALHPHELYVVHKIMLNPVSVRRAVAEDVEVVKQFVSLLSQPGNLEEKFVNSLTNRESKLLTFFLISGTKKDEPLGVVMVNEVTDLDQLKVAYSISSWHDMRRETNENVGVIEYFCMSPLFRSHTRFFLREIHRMSLYLTLFYAMNRFDGTQQRHRPLPAILPDIYPIKPRKIVITGNTGTPTYDEPFSLYLATPRLTSVPRYEVNNRIVVVGSSYTAISFLEGLLFSEHRKHFAIFNNVTLVSKHGLVHSKPPNFVTDRIHAHNSGIDYEYMERLNLRCYVNIVSGLLTSIDRTEKTITINKKQVMSYDLLFLMCGLQYNVPRKLGVKDYLSVKLPSNMFNINTQTDAENALNVLKSLASEYKDRRYNILVYGYTIDTYCCVSALLEFGVSPHVLTLVDQFRVIADSPPSHDFIFQDGELFETVVESIMEKGVTILSGFKLIDWWSSRDDPKQVVLKFESHLRFFEIEALAVFLYPERSVNVEVWRAIVQAGLVFDGRLVVTPDCRTNDPYIYAAGTLTKYPRRYMADHLAHKYFNREEIGEILSKKIRASLIPFTEGKSEDSIMDGPCWSPVENVVPIYKRPLITYCNNLCGGLHFLNVCKPGLTVPRETMMTDDDFGSVLSTGSCKWLDQQGYFRIQLNPYKVVEKITCLSKKPFNYKKLALLWGKHETILNNLVKRFEFTYITDLFAFFESPWCTAIYHDEFPLFEKEMMRIMKSKSEDPRTSPLQDLFNLYEENDYKKLPPVVSKMIIEKFKNSPYEANIKKKLLKFIKDNLISLDMYAHPIVVNTILSAHEESFLFQDL